jgi:hypothetical protein
MILREIHELTAEYLQKRKELENKWVSVMEIKVLESEVKFKIEVLLNWLNYSIFQQ